MKLLPIKLSITAGISKLLIRRRIFLRPQVFFVSKVNNLCYNGSTILQRCCKVGTIEMRTTIPIKADCPHYNNSTILQRCCKEPVFNDWKK